MRCCEYEEYGEGMRAVGTSAGRGAPASGPAWRGEGPFVAVCTLLFALGAAGTAYWCGSMGSGMPMPGGWAMSMAWMRMPGQGWPAAAAMFLGMWLLMMLAMMLPACIQMLLGYRQALRQSGTRRLAAPSLLAGGGYFAVQTAFGALAYPPGALLGSLAMGSETFARWIPALTGTVLILAGLVQMTGWKLSQLERCRSEAPCAIGAADGQNAWMHGVCLGLCCLRCTANLMLVQLVAGVMDLRLMALLTLAISAERLAPAPRAVARLVGAVIVAAGIALLSRS